MTNPSQDSRAALLLALLLHELRAPLTPLSGYTRMLLQDRAGALNDRQREMLSLVEKSSGRVAALVAEIGDLLNLETRTAPLNGRTTDLHSLLSEVIQTLRDIPDRHIDVELSVGTGTATVVTDPVRLKAAITSILIALRRELVTRTTLFVKERTGEFRGKPASWIALGDADLIGAVETATPETLAPFDEWRGGCGLTLPIARLVIERLGGAIWSLPDATKPRGVGLAAAAIVLPHG